MIGTRLPALALLLALAAAAALPCGAETPVPAVVTEAVANLHVRPDETSPVDDQAILGEVLAVVEETAGFARVLGDDGLLAWIPERSIRRGPAPAAARRAEVTSGLAHLYREPDVTRSRPLLTAPLGALLGVDEELVREGHAWLRVTLPDGRTAFVAKADTSRLEDRPRPPGRPEEWIALG